MLDKEKVMLMTELAFYEQNDGKEDFKINEYYRKDYAGYYTLWSVLWVTIGYVVVVGLVALAGMDFILEYMSKSMMMKMALVVIVGYMVVLIIYTLISHHIYIKRHRRACQGMKGFNHNLIKLLKMYDKERQ